MQPDNDDEPWWNDEDTDAAPALERAEVVAWCLGGALVLALFALVLS